jgi:hypothetical protein
VKFRLPRLRKINFSTLFFHRHFEPRDAIMDSVFSPRAQASRSRFVDRATGSSRGIANAVASVFLGVREGLDAMDRYSALSRLSDRALAKRGLTRSEIARAAFKTGTPRRRP